MKGKKTIILIIALLIVSIGAVIFIQINNRNRNNNITQKEATEILEDLYYNARGIYLENSFKYSDKLELLEYTNIRNEELTVEGYQITNYNDVINKVFTENGKKQYEDINNSSISDEGRLIYVAGKVYGNMFAYASDTEYKTTEFIHININENTISCTARNIYSDGRDDIETNFVIKNINGQWLVDEYSNRW